MCRIVRFMFCDDFRRKRAKSFITVFEFYRYFMIFCIKNSISLSENTVLIVFEYCTYIKVYFHVKKTVQIAAILWKKEALS